MLTFLRNIVEGILFIPQYILWAIETLFNGFMVSIHALFEVATALIPLPETPSPPEFIANINWFFPIGALISIMTPIVAGYVVFLSVRWILAKIGEL